MKRLGWALISIPLVPIGLAQHLYGLIAHRLRRKKKADDALAELS